MYVCVVDELYYFYYSILAVKPCLCIVYYLLYFFRNQPLMSCDGHSLHQPGLYLRHSLHQP